MGELAEVNEYHTHLLRCSIEVDHARAYWRHAQDAVTEDTAHTAFSKYWFGARSMSRVKLLLSNFRDRFDEFPPSIDVLHRWEAMDAGTRRLVCHWHLQLADRLYREFTGIWLVARREAGRMDLAKDAVVKWIDQQVPARWAPSTRIRIAQQLTHAATASGLLEGSREPHHSKTPRVSDDALTYLVYLQRGIEFKGSMVDNPYLASVGIAGNDLERRLRGLPALRFRKQGELVEFGWKHDDLLQWANATILKGDHQLQGSA